MGFQFVNPHSIDVKDGKGETQAWQGDVNFDQFLKNEAAPKKV